MQCCDPKNKNSITITLPLKLESGVLFPPGSMMESSGDFRAGLVVEAGQTGDRNDEKNQ